MGDLHVGEYVLRQPGAAIEHRGDAAEDLEFLVGEGPDVSNGFDELADATVAQGIALERDRYPVRRSQPVDREYAERWAAVDQYIVVAAAQCLQCSGENKLSSGLCEQVDLGPSQVDGRREDRR